MARSTSRRTARAARRAAQRDPGATPAAGPLSPFRPTARQGLLLVWAAVTGALLAYGLAALRQKVSWYLAVDQLGYLLFARDLLHAEIFHQWPPAEAFATRLPDPTDVLAQTYLWDHGVMYSRYAPGFPILLAAWTGLFGAPAAHALNPLVFVAVLAVLIAFVWRTQRSLWLGTIVVTLVLLWPTGVTLWALTPTRDLSAHLCGLLGITLLAGRGPLRPATAIGAGLALGYAVSIRPDAVLYLIPAAVFLTARWRAARRSRSPLRLAGAVGLGVLLGAAPSLGFYWMATGNPLRPPQAVEVDDFFGPSKADELREAQTDSRIGYPPKAWQGTDADAVSGEGMKFAHLATTLPGNWAKIRTLYGGVLVILAVAGLAVTAALRPVLAAAVGGYLVAALLFYSFWGRPYGRYLVSIWLLAPVLVANGMLGSVELVRYAARRGAPDLARWGAAAAALLLASVYLTAGPQADGSLRPDLLRLIVGGTVVALGAAAAWPRRRIVRFAAPALGLALALFGTARLAEPSPRATVQRPEIERASALARRTFAPHAVLITTENIGRPAENYQYYTDVDALYLTDLKRWGLTVEEAVFLLLVSEREPYLLIPKSLPQRERLLVMLRTQYLVEVVADIPPERNYDYFVASAFHAGMPLELWRVR